jgi:hypothetical protein
MVDPSTMSNVWMRLETSNSMFSGVQFQAPRLVQGDALTPDWFHSWSDIARYLTGLEWYDSHCVYCIRRVGGA